MTLRSHTVQLEIASRLELIDVVQTLLARLALFVGFDEEAIHYISVAVRESVSNAIRHGNRFDERKRVDVAFSLTEDGIEICVRDEGAGFDPKTLRNPLAQENLLRADGRGVFFMRSFMDEVRFSFVEPRGTTVTLVKKLVELSVDLNIQLAGEAARCGADFVFTGDDYSSGQAPFMSPDTFRELLYPGLKRVVKGFHDHGMPVSRCCELQARGSATS